MLLLYPFSRYFLSPTFDVFKDVNKTLPGFDFREVVKQEIQRADVMLVIIDSDWVKDQRLNNPKDLVHIEVKTGLNKPGLLVVPVLVKGARVPSPEELPPALEDLSFKTAFDVRDDPKFHPDMELLASGIKQAVQDIASSRSQTAPSLAVTSPEAQPSRRESRGVLSLILLASIAIIVLVIALIQHAGGSRQTEPTTTPVALVVSPTEVSESVDSSGISPAVPTATNTEISVTPTSTSISTDTPSPTLTPTSTLTYTPSSTPSPTSIPTSTPSLTPLPTNTPETPPTPFFPVGSRNRSWQPIETTFELPDDSGLSIEMVFVPAGCFQLGSDEGEENAKPTREICVSSFWMSRTEITNEQYLACIADGTCVRPASYETYIMSSDYNKYPVYVTWYQANEYAAWLSAQLPTEIQWEYAARGPQGWKYPWGNAFDGEYLNFCDVRCDIEERRDVSYNDGFKWTAPVGQFESGESWIGAVDMAGNVWEWTATRYSPTYYSELENGVLDPEAPSMFPENSSDMYVMRGGYWGSDEFYTQATVRFPMAPDYSDTARGFRIVFPVLPQPQ